MLKCKRFYRTKNYDPLHGHSIVGPVEHFNKWSSDHVDIVSVQALSDTSGSCTEIIVFYKTKEEL